MCYDVADVVKRHHKKKKKIKTEKKIKTTNGPSRDVCQTSVDERVRQRERARASERRTDGRLTAVMLSRYGKHLRTHWRVRVARHSRAAPILTRVACWTSPRPSWWPPPAPVAVASQLKHARDRSDSARDREHRHGSTTPETQADENP